MLLPAKKSPTLPNYNLQKASTQAARWRAPLAIVTSAYIRGLPADHAERPVYARGGSPAVVAYRQAQQAAK